MKKVVLATILASVFGMASAEPYFATTFDHKDKVASTQGNYVYGLNVGTKLGDGFAVEGRMEDERVEPGAGATQKQEGLGQLKLSKDFSLGMVTPYAAVAFGEKNKSTINFPFYVYEVGAKAKLGDVGFRYGYRQRTALNDNTTNSYNTHENTLAVTYSITKSDAIGVAYKQERGTSNYNTTGLSYTHSF